MSAHTTANPRVGKSLKSGKPYPRNPAFPARHETWARRCEGGFSTSDHGKPWRPRSRSTSIQGCPARRALAARGVSGRHAQGKVLNDFLNKKTSLVASGELTNRSWQEYRTGCDVLVARFGRPGPLPVTSKEKTRQAEARRSHRRKSCGRWACSVAVRRSDVTTVECTGEGVIDR